MFSTHSVLLLAVMAAFTSAQSDRQDRNLKVLYDTWVNMTCADEMFLPETSPGAAYQWVLPSGDPLDTTSDRHHLARNGSTLVIPGVQRSDFGLYLCVVSLPGLPVHHVIRWGLNLEGAFFGDPWVKYWPRGKIGLLAGVAVFVFMSMLCINLDQYDTHHDRPARALQQTSPQSELRPQPYLPGQSELKDGTTLMYRNPAFADDELIKDGPGHRNDQVLDDELEGIPAQGRESEPKTSF